MRRLLAFATVAALLGCSFPALAETPIEQRVSALEARVARLEAALAKLSSLPSAVTPSQATGRPGSWKVRANWRTALRAGMTEGEVIALMGEPDKVMVYSDGSKEWSYGWPVGGTISLDNGKVRSWIEPPPSSF